MAFTTDATTDFSTATGYTIIGGSTVISGGVGTLSAAFVGRGAIRTPQLNNAAWVALNNANPSTVESRGFKIRFLFSFNNWAGAGRKFYNRHLPQGWQAVASDVTPQADLLQAIMDGGMSLADVQRVREWPITGALSCLVGFERTDAADDGSISQLSYQYGSDVISFPGEPASSGTLLHDPLFGYSITWEQIFERIEFRANYFQTIEKSSAFRRRTSPLTWHITAGEYAAFRAQLEAARTVPLAWQPLYLPSSLKWYVSGEVGDSLILADTRRITATLEQCL
jgi:hypothetical protein